MKMRFSFSVATKHFNFSTAGMDFLSGLLERGGLRENKFFFYPYQVYKYLVFLPFLGVMTAFFSTLSLSIAFITRSKVNHFWPTLWARLNSLMTPMSVKVIGKENVDRSQSYIIVANHQSQYDIFVVYGWFPGDFRWVMKKELRKAPVIGYFCEKAGHVYIDRSNTEAALNSINEAKERISGGTSILFFPEGTRSIDETLLPFKKGAFKFALDMGLPILPVSIIGTRHILPSNSMALFPGRATMVIHHPLDSSGYTEDTLGDLMSRSRAIIEKGIADYS
jgi:1-acyl-sn-glycerol-3-phosphate acyltransferase